MLVYTIIHHIYDGPVFVEHTTDGVVARDIHTRFVNNSDTYDAVYVSTFNTVTNETTHIEF